jgi:hypothetical protein
LISNGHFGNNFFWESKVFDKHAPLISKRIRNKHIPWINKNTKNLILERDRMKRKAIISKSDADWSTSSRLEIG